MDVMCCHKEFNLKDDVHLDTKLVKALGLNTTEYKHYSSVANKSVNGGNYNSLERQGTLGNMHVDVHGMDPKMNV